LTAEHLVTVPVRHRPTRALVPRSTGPPAVPVRTGPVLVGHALAAWRDGRLAAAARAARQAVARCEPGTDRHRACSVLAAVLTDIGCYADAAAALQVSASEPPDRRRERVLAAVTARRLLAEGRLDDAVRCARRCLRQADALDRELLVPLALSTVATVTLRRGNLAATTALLRSRPLDGVPPPVTSRLTWLAGQVAEARDGPVAAVELLAGLYDAVGAHRLLLAQEPAAAGWLVRTALAAGHRIRATEVVAGTEQLAAADPAHRDIQVAALHARGLLHGDAAALHRAVRQHRDAWARASAAEDLAVLAGALPGGRGPVPILDGALADYRRCGAERDAARVRSRLRTLGIRRSHWRRADRPASGWDSLTDTERAVARLVTEGLTNRQIASRMFLSPHTVSFHLRHVFRKLDIASRVDLARLTLGHPTADPTGGDR